MLARIAQAFPGRRLWGCSQSPGTDWWGEQRNPTTYTHTTATTKGDVGGGWSAVPPTTGKDQCAWSDPGTLRGPETLGVPEAGRERPRPNARGRGGSAGTQAQFQVRGWALPRGPRRAMALTRRSWVHPLVGFPSRSHPREDLSAHPPWLSSTATHTETPTQTAHTFAPTLSFTNTLPHARTNTHTRTLSLTNIPVYMAIASTFTYTQLHTYTHIVVQPNTLKKTKT